MSTITTTNSKVIDGNNDASIFEAAFNARMELGASSVQRGEGVKEDPARNKSYDELLFSCPSTQAIAQKTRDVMRLGRGSRVLDIGGSLCLDMQDINEGMQGFGQLIVTGEKPETLNQAIYNATNLGICVIARTAKDTDVSFAGNIMDAIRLVRRFQNSSNPGKLAKNTIRMLRPNRKFVAVDAHWAEQNLIHHSAEIPASIQATFAKVAAYSDNGMEFGVPNPSIAPNVASIFESAGAQNIVSEECVVRVRNPHRLELITAPTRKKDQLVKADIATAEEMDEFIAYIHEEMGKNSHDGNDGLELQLPYYITSGKAPIEPSI